MRERKLGRRTSSRAPAKAAIVEYSEAQTDVAFVIARATEVIGDSDRAMRWLGTPVRALNYATPISLLGTKEGVQKVAETLGRLEHGLL